MNVSEIRTEVAWLVHNLISHPLSGILSFVGLERAASVVHDATVPAGVLDPTRGFIIERVEPLEAQDAHECNDDCGEPTDFILSEEDLDTTGIETGLRFAELLKVTGGQLSVYPSPNLSARDRWIVSFKAPMATDWTETSGVDLRSALTDAVGKCTGND